MYFTDALQKHIGVCSETGDICTVLHRENITGITSLALHPKKGLMYWTDCHPWNSKIETSGMDGSNRKVFTTDVSWSEGLTVDISQDRLYWIDKIKEIIETVKLDGSDRKVIVEETIGKPHSFALLEDKLYWTDKENDDLKTCNKVSCENPSVFLNDKTLTIGIYHPSLEPPVENPCKTTPCSDLCFLTPNNSYSCGCPETSVLEADNHTCREIFKPLRFAVGGGNELFLVSTKFLGRKNQTLVHLPNIHEIGCMTYDSLTSSLIISDSVDQKLYRYNLSSNQLTTLLNSTDGKIISMSFDSYGNNLYYCIEGKNTVNVLSLHTKHQITIYRTAEGVVPNTVLAIPDHGIFFLVVKEQNKKSSLYRVTSDGRHMPCIDMDYNKEVILTYSKKTQKVFWSDYTPNSYRYPDTLESMNINCFNHKSLRDESGSSALISITNDDGIIIWLDQDSPDGYFFSEDPKLLSSGRKINLESDKKLKNIVSVNEITPNNLHPCQDLNSGCSHVCLVTSNNQEYLCRCPSEMLLKNDNKTCEAQ